jgi:putative ABC transport system permease protein
VGATLSFSGLISHDEATIAFTGEGVDTEVERIFISVEIVDGGQSLSPGDPNGIVLGRGLAANLGVGVGDTVVLLATTASGGVNAVEARVRGLFFTVSKAYDDVAIRVPLPLAQTLLRTSKVHRWIVVLDDTAHTRTALDAIRERVGPGDLELVPWHRLADFYNKANALLSKQVAVVKVMIALIIILTISNTLTMNVLERTGEIGTMMALGVRRPTVLRRFLGEATMVGLIGGALGCILGVALAEAISAKGIPMPPPPGRSEGYLGEIMVSWKLVLSAFLLAMTTTVIAGLYPAWKASRLVIVDALRHNR